MLTTEVAERGRSVVADLLSHRGLEVSERFEGRRPVLDVVGSDGRRRRIRVSTKTRGDWQSRTTEGDPDAPDEHDRYWAFVDLRGSTPVIRFALEGAVRRDIHAAHQRYLRSHGGHRARNPMSVHHSITEARVEALAVDWPS